ncbi:MAG: fimbrillin family protein [Dysgonamonadaceae bacterium]|nr:fimbrillin family protein [Dysgonamonadaceae bacterium]
MTPAPGTGGAAGIAPVGSYTGYPSFTITPPATPADQKDICVAAAMNLNKGSNDGKVLLSFDHAMAKISFSARYTGSLSGGQYVKVKQIYLDGVAGSGTLSLTSSGFNWTAGSNLTNYVLSVSNGALTNASLTTTAGPVSITPQGTLLLVPQTPTANTRIQLVVAFFNGTTEKEYEVDAMLPSTPWEAGKQITYSLEIKLSNGYMSLDVPVPSAIISSDSDPDQNQWNYSYTELVKTFSCNQSGYYQLEAWGVAGDAGAGGYVKGTLYLKAGQEIYVYVGGNNGWNGGIVGGLGSSGDATDFRLVTGDLNSRIMVAGGAGGDDLGVSPSGGAAGGLIGYGPGGGGGGAQTGAGGDGSFGKGGLGSGFGGGAGGYYGGAGGDGDCGSGGSSFISGMSGCVAINPASASDPRAQDAIGNTAALNYSSILFGASSTWTDGSEILFTNCSMIDGEGYEWNTGAKGAVATAPVSPGSSGTGYARITRLE